MRQALSGTSTGTFLPVGVVSMDAPFAAGKAGETMTIADILADPDADIEGPLLHALDLADTVAPIWELAGRLLVPRQFDILRLHYREGLTFAEIAERRGENHRAIQTGHANAIAHLRRWIARCERARGGWRLGKGSKRDMG